MSRGFIPGNLLVSESVFAGNPGIVAGQTAAAARVHHRLRHRHRRRRLPARCSTTTWRTAASGSSRRIFLDRADARGGIRSLGPDRAAGARRASWSPASRPSRSWRSTCRTDGRYVTFMGYVAPAGHRSTCRTPTPPGVVDPTNPVPGAFYRAAAQLVRRRAVPASPMTNAYSGNNGRAAILNDKRGAQRDLHSGQRRERQQPAARRRDRRARARSSSRRLERRRRSRRRAQPHSGRELQHHPARATRPDKIGKDDELPRPDRSSYNVVYYTKGSGSNGVNTVYFLDTTGKEPARAGSACRLPRGGAAYLAARLRPGACCRPTGCCRSNMCVLQGLQHHAGEDDDGRVPVRAVVRQPGTRCTWPTRATATTRSTRRRGTYTAAAGADHGRAAEVGLRRERGVWKLAYTLQGGLEPRPAVHRARLPDRGQRGDRPARGRPATDGLRNITGRVNPNGTATIWAVTSTVSGGGDQGADPNKLVAITDHRWRGRRGRPGRAFRTVRAARFGEVLRGVSFTPGTR